MNKYLIYDTETTGLNIKIDKPFLFPYIVLDENLKETYRYMFDAKDTKAKNRFIEFLKEVEVLVGHNIKFDVNMSLNLGIDSALFKTKKYIDTSVLARLVIDHDTQIDKTFSTALKKLATRYLHKTLNEEEQKLKREFRALIAKHKEKMKQYFIDCGLWDTSLSKTKQTKHINRIYNKWFKYYHEYPQLIRARKTFLKNNPPPTYADCSNVETYAMLDVDLTKGLFLLFYPQVKQKKQEYAFVRTSNVTYPLIDMERQGLVVDIDQVLHDRAKIIAELARVKIIDPRTNTELSIGQHAKLKELYEYESGQNLNSADKATRAEIEDVSPSARAANYIAKLDKYLSTYITRVLSDVTKVDGEYRMYSQYNLAGTVTGRLSSNFQQFPKKPLTLEDGYTVDIRGWFTVPKGYKYMYYFDYSQMELRLQCEWTNIVNGEPDINLARGFSPYKCTEIDGEYYLNEDLNTPWKPIDFHSLTAYTAFPDTKKFYDRGGKEDPDFEPYRTMGKRANFACNYGAGAAKIASSLKIPHKEAAALVHGYKQTFKGVVQFGKWLQGRTYSYDNTPNLLLRRYYSRNKHKLQNWLVQGSGADILLEKIYEVWIYIQDKPWWKLFITVHDEIGLYVEEKPEEQLEREAKEIQNIMTYKLSAVDITVDIERTETCWSEKYSI